jgi:Mg-chelatase subunit ChlD
MYRRAALVAGISLWLALAIPPSYKAASSTRLGRSPLALGKTSFGARDAAFFTFSYAPDFVYTRCVRSIAGLQLDTDAPLTGLHFGRSMLASLRATSDLSVVVAGFGKWFLWQDFEDPGGLVADPQMAAEQVDAPYGSIYVMRRRGQSLTEWDVATTVIGPSLYNGIEIMPDRDTLLVATVGSNSSPTTTMPPFRVEKYSLGELSRISGSPNRQGTHRLGPSHGAIHLPAPAVAILRDIDGHHVHVLTKEPSDGTMPLEPRRLALHTIDSVTMVESAPSIALSDWLGYPVEALLPMMALSPDGRYMVTTTGVQPTINIVDMVARQARPVVIGNANEMTDVAFSSGDSTHGLLAVNVRRLNGGKSASRVVIFELEDNGITELGQGPEYSGNMAAKPSAIEWSASGEAVIAGVDFMIVGGGKPVPMAVLLSVQDGGRQLVKVRDLQPCSGLAFVMDVLTTNGLEAPTATPTPTAVPSITATATATATSTATPTLTPEATVVASPTVTSTQPPGPVYLPGLLREACIPELRQVDLMLVIDASTTMLEKTRAGRTKIDAAIAAAATLAADLDVDRDRLGLVWFNDASHLEVVPTFDRAAFRDALGRIQVRELTRIELGVAAAHSALTGASRRLDARPVIMLITDGRANPGPESLALAAADSAKADDITVFTVGIGERIDAVSLQSMATSPNHYVHAPDGEDLPAAYARVRDALPCPDSAFWP